MRSILERVRAAFAARRGLRCSFCGRDASQVQRLVAGPSVHICDTCIARCVVILQDNGGFDGRGLAAAVENRPTG